MPPAARLVAVGGMIASGKTSVARALAADLGAELCTADEIRAEYRESGRAEADAPGFSPIVYASLFERAAALLAGGRPVVLDATFRSRQLRAEARALAARFASPFRFVECRAGERVCRERLVQREEHGERGWLALFEHFLPLWEPVEELSPAEHVVLDTAKPLPLASAAELLMLNGS